VLVCEPCAYMGAILEADGAIWEVCVPYGSHVHWIGALWEPDSTIWKEDGVVDAVMGATCTKRSCRLWESDGTMWEPHVTYEDHRRAVCTVWVVCAPYLMQMVPYGSHIHCEGTIRELCAPSWSHV
jgi:hypothetical protein